MSFSTSIFFFSFKLWVDCDLVIGLIQGNSKAKPKNSNSSLFRFSATWILQAKIRTMGGG